MLDMSSLVGEHNAAKVLTHEESMVVQLTPAGKPSREKLGVLKIEGAVGLWNHSPSPTRSIQEPEIAVPKAE